MYSVGDRIIYGENGVCTVVKIAPLEIDGSSGDRLYYHMTPYVGSGTFFSPVSSGAFMRPVISSDEAEALIDLIPSIQPAICSDSRFNHVDAFYKELFKQHTPEAMVAIIKGINMRMSEKKTKSSRAEAIMKRAKDILHGELSVALAMDIKQVEGYIKERVNGLQA